MSSYRKAHVGLSDDRTGVDGDPRQRFISPALDHRDLPLFRTADEALRWAQHPSSETVRAPGLYGMGGRQRMEAEEGSGTPRVIDPSVARKPTGLDAAAQAGLIKSCVESMTRWERRHIEAKYFRGSQRQEAQADLTSFVLPTLWTGVHHRRLVYRLVARFYGKRVNVKMLASEFDLQPAQAYRYARAVHSALDRIAVRAEDMVSELLRRRGVIA